MPGSEAPRTKRSPWRSSTSYQMPGMLGERWGSPAISGVPVLSSARRRRPSCWSRRPRRQGPSSARTASICSTSGIPSPGPGFQRFGDDRVVGWIAGVEPGGQLGAQRAHHVGPHQLPLPVGREAEGQQLAEAENVDRPPRHRVLAQDLHLERQRLGVAGGGVDAGAEALEHGAQLGLKRRFLGFGEAPDPQRPHQLVDRQALRAGHLGDPSRDDPPVEVQLPEPVLAVAEALGEEEVLAVGSLDVGHAPTVAADGDPIPQLRDLDRPLVPAAAAAGRGGARGRPRQRQAGRYRPLPQKLQPAPPASSCPGYWLGSQFAA